jgi:hypothetical protein
MLITKARFLEFEISFAISFLSLLDDDLATRSKLTHSLLHFEIIANHSTAEHAISSQSAARYMSRELESQMNACL